MDKNKKNKQNKRSEFKEFFKPTKKKLITSIIIALIWLLLASLFLWARSGLCRRGDINYGFKDCTDYYYFLIIHTFHRCDHINGICTPLNAVVLQYFWLIAFPFTLTYLIYSIITFFASKFKNYKK